MTALQVIEKGVLIDTLLSVEEPIGTFPIRALVLMAGTANVYKIFWEHAPDSVELPYLVISHMSGGRYEGTDTSQKYSDTSWKIVMHTANMAATESIVNAIGLLQNLCPVCTNFPGVSVVAPLHEKAPIFDRYVVQNVPLFIVGGLYRLRLNLGAN